MKNKDMPAMPQSFSMIEGSCGTVLTHLSSSNATGSMGITKLEHFSGLAMQAYITGQISWTNGVDGGVCPGYKEAAEEAVAYAEALLEELESRKAGNE